MLNRTCILLFKAQLKNELRRMTKSRGGMLKVFVWPIMGLLIAYYAYRLSYEFGSCGMADLIPGFGIAAASMAVFFFTVVKTNGVLFAYGEYDTLMALPVKTGAVITSRFLTLYVMNLTMTALVMLPMGVGYVQWTHPGLFFYPAWIIGIVTAPLLPTTLAAVLGILIILVSSRFRRSSAAATILYPVLVIGLIGLQFSVMSMADGSLGADQMKSVSALLLQKLNSSYLPAAWFYDGIVLHQLFQMAAFIISSILCYYIFVRLVSIKYKKLNTVLTTHHVRNDYRVTEIRSNSSLMALYKKEVKRFFSSTMYCVNMIMGSLMTVFLAAASFFVNTAAIELAFQDIGGDLTRVFPFVIGTLISMTCTTCVSLSLEGKNIWILQSLPVSPVTIYKSKMLLNFTLQLPSALVAAVCLNLRFSMPLFTRVMLFVIPVGFALFSTVGGMYLNLKMPDYEWTSEIALIKRSGPSMCGILGGMLLGVVLIVCSFLVHHLAAAIYMTGTAAFLLLGSWGLWRQVKKLKI